MVFASSIGGKIRILGLGKEADPGGKRGAVMGMPAEHCPLPGHGNKVPSAALTCILLSGTC